MRLFLAIDPDRTARAELGALGLRLRRPGDGWRWTDAASLHLTLRFLGEVDESRSRRALDLWREATSGFGSFPLRARGLGHFPPRGRPRVLWVGFEGSPGLDRLVELAARLELATREAGFPPEARPFSPHLTLARAARTGRPRAPGPVAFEGTPFEVGEVVLFQSELAPSGARYTPRAALELGGGGSRNGSPAPGATMTGNDS